MLARVRTIAWASAAETKELLWDSESGRELLCTTLMVLVAIYVAGRFVTYWQRLTVAQLYSHVHQTSAVVLIQRVLMLEDKQRKLNDELLALQDQGNLASWLKTLEDRVDRLESSTRPFNFSNPFSNTNIDPPETSRKHQSLKRIRGTGRADVRECCRTLYGNDWWNHPNKSQRMAAAKRKLTVERSDEK